MSRYKDKSEQAKKKKQEEQKARLEQSKRQEGSSTLSILANRNTNTADNIYQRMSLERKGANQNGHRNVGIQSGQKNAPAYTPARTRQEYDSAIATGKKELSLLEELLSKKQDFGTFLRNTYTMTPAAASAQEAASRDEWAKEYGYGSWKEAQDRYDALQREMYFLEGGREYDEIPTIPGFKQASKVDSSYKKDDTYAYINNIDGFRNRQYSGAMSGGGANKTYAGYDKMTDYEVGTYNAIYATEGKEAAEKYLEYLSYSLSERDAQEAKENAEYFAQKAPVLSDVMSTPMNLVGGVEGAVDVLGQKVAQGVTGQYKPIDFNRGTMAAQAGSAIRGYRSEQLNDLSGTIQIDAEKNPVLSRFLNGKGVGDLYQLGMSMVDSGAAAGISAMTGTGWLGGALLGTSAGTQAMIEAANSGATDSQAIWTGITNGAFEMLFEKVSIDRLLSYDGKNIIKSILTQGMVEGSEEAATSVANTLADIYIMAADSEWSELVDQYMVAGDDLETARWKALRDKAVDIAYDFAAGSLTGGIMGGGASAVQNVTNRFEETATLREEAPALVAKSQELSGDTELGTRIQERIDSGKKVSGRDLRALVAQNEQAIATQTATQAEAMLTELGETGNVAEVAQVVGKMATGQRLTRQEMQIFRDSQNAADVLNEINEAEATTEIPVPEATETAQEAQIPTPVEVEGESRNVAVEAPVDQESASVPAPAAEDTEPAETDVKAAQGATLYEDESRELESNSKQYGEQAEDYIRSFESGQNVAEYDTAWKAGYELGMSQVPQAQAMESSDLAYLTPGQRVDAYEAGLKAAGVMAGQQEARVQGMTRNATGTRKRGIVRAYNGINTATLAQKFNDSQRKAYKILSTIADVTGIEIVLYESSPEADGVYREAQGKYIRSQPGRIFVDLNAGISHVSEVGDMANYTMLATFTHEFVHFCENWNPIRYNELRKAVFDAMAEHNINVEERIDQLMANSKGELSREDASREAVAEALVEILPDANFVEQLANEHKTLFRKLLERLKEFLQEIKDYFAGMRKSNDPTVAALKEEVDGMARYMEHIVKLFDNVAVEAVNRMQEAAMVADTMSNTEAFADSAIAVQNQIRPPYNEGTKAFNAFADGLSEEARKTFDLFYGFYDLSRITNATNLQGKTVKKINISAPFVSVSQWNDKVRNDAKWGETAKKLAAFLDADTRKRMNMNEDGTLNETPLEKAFKMQKSIAQRLVDSLPVEDIDAEYTIDDSVTVTLPTAKARQSVGGEAYRRALIGETRKLYHEGKLKQVSIGTMSKDRWGSLGFLAANGKTTASGDFTTVCPQMMFNKGCFYCYRRAAMESGVNNKLVAEKVWYAGEILRIKDKDIADLNRNGGLRIQSFGDWMPHFSAMLADVLYDAELRGLQVKIITKEPSMIEYLASLKDQGIGKNLYFNLSADYVLEKAPAANNTGGSDSLEHINPDRPFVRREGQAWWKRAMAVEEAAKYRAKYDWVNTRIVATTTEEFIRGLKDPTVDVVTGYHGNIRQYDRIDSVTGQTQVEVEALGDAGMPRWVFLDGKWNLVYKGKTQTHQRLAERIQAEGLELEYYAKTCCQTGRCSECEGKCGKMSRSMTMKNATNRDEESVSYWRTMQNIQDESLEISPEEWEAMGGTQFQRRPTNRLSDLEVLNAAADGLEGLSLTEAEENSLGVMRQKLARLAPISDQIEEHERLAEEYAERDPDEAQKERNRAIVLKTKRTRELNSILAGANGPIMRRVLQKARSIVERQELTEYRASRKESELAKRYKARIEKDVNELIAWGMKPDTKNALKHIPEGIKGPVMDFLETIDFSSKRKLAGGADTKKDLRLAAKLQAIKSALDGGSKSVISEDYKNIVLSEAFFGRIESLISEVSNLTSQARSMDAIINEMSAKGLEDLSDLIKNLKKLITDFNTFHKNAMFAHVYEAGKETTQTLREMKPMGGANPVGGYMDWSLARPAYVWERFGKGGESIWHELQNAQADQAFHIDEVEKWANKTYSAEEVKAWEKDVRKIELSDGKTVEMTVAQIMALYKLRERQQALGHLLGEGMRIPKTAGIKQSDEGHFLTEADLDAITGELNDRQKAVADKLQKYMQDKGSEWGNQVTMVRFGEKLFGEPNYYPIHVDRTGLSQTLDEPLEAQSLYALLNMGFTKQTKEDAKNRIVIYSIFDEFSTHMASMATYNAFALPVVDAIKWFNYSEGTGQGVRAQLARVYGREKGFGTNEGKSLAEAWILNQIKAINGTNRTQMSVPERLIGKATSTYNRAQIAANLSVVIQQPFSVLRATNVISPVSLAAGEIKKWGQVKSVWAEMDKHSGIALWKKLGFYDVNITRGLSEMIKHDKKITDKIADGSMKLAELMDRWAWATMWQACKHEVEAKQNLKPGAEGYWDAVSALFDEVIYKTQVVDSPLAKAEFMTSKSVATRPFTAFMSEPLTAYNNAADAFYKFRMTAAKDGKGKAWNKHKGAILRGIAVYASSSLVQAMVTALRDAWRDDDEYARFGEKWVENFWANFWEEMNPFSKLPWVSDIVNSVLLVLKENEIIKADVYESSTAAQSLIDLANKLLRQHTKDTKYTDYGKIYNWLKALSGATGIPFANLTREVISIWNNTVGGLYPDKKIQTYDPGDKQSIREALESGYLTEEEAADALRKAKVTDSNGDPISYEGTAAYWAYKANHPDEDIESSWFDKYYDKGAKKAGIKQETYLSYRKKVKDKDAKKDILPIINGMNITKAQKDALYREHTNWSEDALSEAPWH